MAQLFSPRANVKARVLIFGTVAFVCAGGWATSEIYWSPYATYVDVPFQQPIPFSHKHHVGDDGIDCRYCHTTVETAAHAGLPSTAVCLTCHAQLYRDQPLLAPLHESAASDQPIAWRRVHVLPEFVYFNHSVH